MDRPILALTLPRKAAPPGQSPDAVAVGNMGLLIQLRWIAVAGQLATILAVAFGLGVAVPVGPMLALVCALGLANLFAFLRLSRSRVTQTSIFLALLLDVSALALQLYLSGGAANPFISLFLLQVVLGAILLEFVFVAVLTLVAMTAYGALTAWGLPLVYPPELTELAPRLEAVAAWVSFALTAGLLAVFITRITRNLRARDAYLAEMRRHAAEEDGIVRMGLFASGAAHELGTPLSSLSVILNDWSRMPRLNSDPELAGELAEMQREVGRCKSIVSDILHAAGAPRGETAGIVAAEPFLNEVADAWRLAHPGTPLDYESQDLETAVLVAEPAVRQVIASLLDNAAEASPAGVALKASLAAEGLQLLVADRGPGFTAEQLAAIGKPNQSSKGAGRGLGLFLAASLARRLGGRLSATNRPEGGANVLLVLPLALDRLMET